ncbi:MAG: hypothetical protein ACLQLT_12285 [Methylovirgula sp.]
MVTKRTGRPRGRPAGERRDLRDDPDRRQVCFGLALQVLGFDQHRAFVLAATGTPLSREIEPDLTIRPGEKLVRLAFELTPKPWAASSQKKGTRRITFAGRVTTLKRKSMRVDFTPEERVYVNRLVKAIATALIGGPPQTPQVLEWATSVGEGAFAHRVLLPLMFGVTCPGEPPAPD